MNFCWLFNFSLDQLHMLAHHHRKYSDKGNNRLEIIQMFNCYYNFQWFKYESTTH